MAREQKHNRDYLRLCARAKGYMCAADPRGALADFGEDF
jgi:hypothetical protein